ncbi:MAG TPA: polymer-forming cytoskeletal protein [Planctomycetes bacterium]|nr:polymer-forming cytoskeletal protein [Planctomycetota bacterium]
MHQRVRCEVRGDVRGSIIAVAIALHETAKVEGDIMHQKLSISEGAEFDGSVKLIRDTSELTPILDAEVIARQTGAPQPSKQPDFGSLNGQPQAD